MYYYIYSATTATVIFSTYSALLYVLYCATTLSIAKCLVAITCLGPRIWKPYTKLVELF